MKTRPFYYTLFLLLSFILLSQAVKAVDVINSTALMVPIKDLTESIKPDGKKYYMLSLSEFEKMKSEKQRVLNILTPIKLPSYANISSTKITGEIRDNFVFATANIKIEKFGDDYIEIPVLTGKTAIEKALINGKQASIVVDVPNNGYKTNIAIWDEVKYKLPISKSGRYDYEISFITPISEYGVSRRIDFTIGKSPITFFELKSENKLIEIFDTTIPSYAINKLENNGCQMVGQLGSTNNINIEYQYIIPEEKIESEEPKEETKEEPKEEIANIQVASETSQIATESAEIKEEEKPIVPPEPVVFAHSEVIYKIGRNEINVDKHIVYDIKRAPITELSFEIPNNLDSRDIKDIKSRNLNPENKRIVKDGDKKILKIKLPRKIIDRYDLSISYDVRFTDKDNNKKSEFSFVLPEIVSIGIDREIGNVAVVSLGSDEIRSANSDSEPLGTYTKEIDVTELPSELKNSTDRPILLAYNYAATPSNIAVSVSKCDDIAQKYAVADSLVIRTTFNNNKTSNTELEFNLKNTNSGSLNLMPASGTHFTVTSATLNGKVIKPTTNASQTIIIPLAATKNSINPETTNIIIGLKQSIATLSWTGAMQFTPPVPNIPVSKVLWKLYAPENLHLYGFDGTVEEINDESQLPFFLKGFMVFYGMAKEFFTDNQTQIGILIIIGVVLLIAFWKVALSIIKAIISGFGSLIGGIANLFTSKTETDPHTGKEVTVNHGLSFLINIVIICMIIGMLSAMSMPNFKTSRWQSRQKACYSNIRVIQGAVEMYNMDKSTMMSDLNLSLLGNYIKNPNSIKCPEYDNARYVGTNLDSDGEVYCTHHGDLNGNIKGGASINNQSAMAIAPEAKKTENYQGFAIKTTSVKSALPAPRSMAKSTAGASITDSYGAQKRKGKALVTQLQITNNIHEFKRELLLPELDENGTLKQNVTYPKLAFAYVNKNYTSTLKILIGIVAFITACGFVFGAMTWSWQKFAASALLILILSITDMNYNIIGTTFNNVFWFTVGLGILIAIFNKFKEESEGTSRSGFMSLTIAILITLSALFAAPAFAQDNVVKDLKVLTPVTDFSKVIPENGNVVFLTEEDYDYLKDLKVPEVKIKENPNSYVIKSISYVGKEENNNVKFTAKFMIDVLKDGYHEIPLIENSAIVTSLKLDGKPHPAAFTKEKSYKSAYCIITDKQGTHEIEIEFIKNVTNGANEFEPRTVAVDTICSGISTLKFIPKDNSEISVAPAALKQKTNEIEQNAYEAIIHPSTQFVVTITPKKTAEQIALLKAREEAELARQKAEEEALLKEKEIIDETQQEEEIIEITPTKVSANINVGLSVKSTFLKGYANCRVNVSGTYGITKFAFKIPENIKLMDVHEENKQISLIRDWQDTQKDNGRFILISFKSELASTGTNIIIEFEQDLNEDSNKSKFFDVPDIEPLKTDEMTGKLAIGCQKELEISAGIAQGYRNIAVENIPYSIKRIVENTIYAYEYDEFPNSLKINVAKPENVEMITALIDEAEAVSTISKDGDVFTKYKFQIRNNSEQFLKIKLPEKNGRKTELWESRCNGKPVIAGLDKKNNAINIPIVKSNLNSNDEAQPFYAEITLHENIGSIDRTKEATIALPGVHLTISKLLWQIKTPDGYEAQRKEGNVEEEQKSNLRFIYRKDYSTTTITRKNEFNQNSGILPVSFNLPNYENSKLFSLLQIEPDGTTPYINLKLYGKPTSNIKIFTLLAALVGILLGFSVMQIFRSEKHKAIWVTTFIITLTTTVLSMSTNVIVSKTAVTSTFATITLFLIALLLRKLSFIKDKNVTSN